MGLRGRKPESQENFHRIYPERAKPPRGLPKKARELWQSIIKSLPPDYFRASELHLLAKFVMADHIYHLGMAEVEKTGIVLPMGNQGYAAVNPALTVCNKQTQIMCTLATKLRLCPNSRVSKWKAGAMKENKPSKRPGLMFGSDDDD
jgi:P27 family predicted phage terminase small subunit